MVAGLRLPVIRRKVVLLGSGALALVAAVVVTAFAVTGPGGILMPINPEIHVAGTKAGTPESQGMRMSDKEIAKVKAEIANNEAKTGPNGLIMVGGSPGTSAQGPTLSNSDSAPAARVSGAAMDDTVRLMEGFGPTVTIAGQRVLKSQPATVGVTTDPCLVDWAKTALPTYDGTSFIGLVPVCGVTAAVFVAGAGMDGRDLVGRAADNTENAPLRDVLFGKAALRVGAAATIDRKAAIMVVTTAS